MPAAALPPDEAERLDALHSYRILDTAPEKVYDDIVQLAAIICNAPIAVMTLIDNNRQWFKSRLGFDAQETTRDVSFCAHALLRPDETMIVPDATQDPRFSDNPWVMADPGVRFYAGSPLLTPSGKALGTLCVVDHQPRTLLPAQAQALKILGHHMMVQMELNKKIVEFTRFHKLSVNRELEMVRLKKEINSLLEQGGHPQRYVFHKKAA